MKICVAQSKAINGDIEKNIQQHLKVIDRAISYGVDVIVFPELSITGYEPSLSKELAILPGDHRLTVFQKKAIDHHINICVCLLYTSPSPRDATLSRMPSSA